MANIYSIASGLASNQAIWSGGVVPVQGDRVHIAAGHTVEIDGTYTWGDDSTASIVINTVTTTSSIYISGTLKFSRTVNSSLTAWGNVLCNVNGRWDQGTQADPIPASVTSIFRFNGSAAPSNRKYNFNSPTQSGNSFAIYGAEKTIHSTFVSAIAQTDVTFEVADATGWKVGDFVFFGPASDSASYVAGGESREITALTPTTGAKALVTIGAALSAASSAGRIVVNLSRNVQWMPASTFPANININSGTLNANNSYELGFFEVRNYGTDTSSLENRSILTLFAGVPRIRTGCRGISVHDIRVISGATVTSYGAIGNGYGVYGSSAAITDIISHSSRTSTQHLGFALSSGGSINKPIIGGCAFGFGPATVGNVPLTVTEPLMVAGHQTTTAVYGMNTASNLAVACNVTGGKVRGLGTIVARFLSEMASLPQLRFTSVDFGSTNGSASQLYGAQFSSSNYYELTFSGCTFPPQFGLNRVDSNLSAINSRSIILINDRDNNPDKQERYTYGGQMIRDTTTQYRGDASARVDCWFSANPYVYTFKLKIAAGQTATFVGAMRFNSTYGTATPPKVGLSGLGLASVEYTAPAVANTWHPYSVSITNTNAIATEITVTYTAQSAANATGAYAWFDGVPDSPWVNSARHFGYLFDSNAYRTADARITMTEAAALALPVTVDHTTQTITVSGALSNAQVFNALMADLCQTSNLTHAVHVSSSDGAVFSTTYTITFSGSGSISGNYTDATGTQVLITAPAIISGSRVQLYNETTNTEIYNGILGSTGVSVATTFSTADVIRLRADHATKLPLETAGVLSASGLVFLDVQVEDTVYAQIGIDGSTVTECSADGPNIQIDISDPDGETTIQRIYAWMSYYQTTAAGIASDFFGAMTAINIRNIRIDQAKVNLKLDNVSATPLVIKGGTFGRLDGSTVIAASSGSIQMDPEFAYEAAGSSGLSPTQEAKLDAVKAKTDLLPAEPANQVTVRQIQIRVDAST